MLLLAFLRSLLNIAISVWHNSLFIPGLAAVVSVKILGLHLLFSLLRRFSCLRLSQTHGPAGESHSIIHVKPPDQTIVAFQVVRLLSCLTLSTLSLYTFLSLSDDGEHSSKSSQLPQIILCGTYVSFMYAIIYTRRVLT